MSGVTTPPLRAGAGETGTLARRRSPRAALGLLVITGIGAIVVSWAVAQHSLIGARWHLLVLIGLWVPLWLVGALAAQRIDRRVALTTVFVLAALLRGAAATGTTPSISNDLYRYAWDAHVQLAGVDPYRYAPDAPQLESLRTPGFWPDPAECRHIGKGPGCTVLNRRSARTIYPAVAEAWFVAVHLVDPGDDGARPWQIAGGLVDLGCIALLAAALRRRGHDPRTVAWYALSPLPVIEFAGNGHVDGVALALFLAASLALDRGRRGVAGALVGLAIMVKLYPALALAAGWRRGRWRFVLTAAATAAATEAPHVAAVGLKVVGYLPGYLREEHYESGGRFLLVGILPLPGHVIIGLAAAVLVGAVAVALRRGGDFPAALFFLLAALVMVTTPAQPWYSVAVAGVAVLAGRPWFLVVPLATEVYYAALILNDPHQIGIGRACYGVAAGVCIIAEVHRRRAGADGRLVSGHGDTAREPGPRPVQLAGPLP